MKSAFGSKRKPRKIEVDEEDEITSEPTITRTYIFSRAKFIADFKILAD